MTNSQLLHRIGCEDCEYTGTVYIKGIGWDTCRCMVDVARAAVKERGLDEDNYMEQQGIKSN